MKVESGIKKISGLKTNTIEFDNIAEFVDYCKKGHYNSVFKNANHDSIKNSFSFTQTESLTEAYELLIDGWSSMAEKLTKILKASKNSMAPSMKAKPVNSVCGFQAIVPAYLQGLPNSMVSRKMVPIKNKVVTINKDISYHCGITTDQIIEDSIRVLKIVNNLESNGYKCNVNIIFGVESSNKFGYIAKVKIKSANERLNVSKLAFPMVHPSMLRRLMLRMLEVTEIVDPSNKNLIYGYGHPLTPGQIRKMMNANEVFFPKLFDAENVENIKSVDDLMKALK